MPEQRTLLTRQEIEQRLEKGLLNTVVTYEAPTLKQITGKVQRLSVWVEDNELMVTFKIDHTQYKCDLGYFTDNITIHGNTSGRTVRSILRHQ